MTNEVKEILDIIKKVRKAEVNSYNGLIETPPMKWEILLDYITNLQEKIEMIKSIYESMQFSAPENLYIFVEQLGEILKDNKWQMK